MRKAKTDRLTYFYANANATCVIDVFLSQPNTQEEEDEMYSCEENLSCCQLSDDDKETTTTCDSDDDVQRAADVEYEINADIIEYDIGFGSAGAEHRMW